MKRIRELHQRAKNIVIDGSRKFAKKFALFALKKKYAIALEELTGLIEELRDEQTEQMEDDALRLPHTAECYNN